MIENQHSTPKAYTIDDLVVVIGQRRVYRGKQEIELPKLSFVLLVELARAAPDTLSIDEIIDRVWKGGVVSPATVAKRVELLRQALNDDPRQPRYVALVRSHGYRLVSTVRVADDSRRGRRASIAAIAAIVLIAAALAWFGFSLTRPPPEKSVAVLPFVSMTDVAADENFADGLTEELSHTLAGVSGLKVTGRTSSFYYKGKSEDLRDIGEALGVAHLLEGSVRRSDDRLRITAQLIAADDGFHLWSKTYDRTMADVLDIQEDIARHVVATLRNTLFDDQEPIFVRDESVNPQAYALYLRAVNPPGTQGMDRLIEAQPLLEQAVEIDPTFAAAWARLATVHGRRIMGLDESYPYSREEGWRRIVEANDKALALDPNNAQVHANLGGIAWLLEGDAVKAAPLIKRALELDPRDLEIVGFAAQFAKLIGRIELAIELEEYLLDRDPLCNDCRFNLGQSYMYAGHMDEAEEIFRTLKIVWGGGLEWSLGMVLLSKEDPALASFEELDHHEYIRIQGRAMALYDLGRQAEFDAAMLQLRDSWGDKVPTVIAEAYAYADQPDAAFAWLDRSLATNLVDLQTDFLEPTFNKIRDDARWLELMDEIGRSPEQLAEIDFQVDLTEIAAAN